MNDDQIAAVLEDEHPRLVGLLVLYLGGDTATAEELAQETLIRLLTRLRRGADIEHLSAWTGRVALNLANSWLRRRRAELRALVRHGADSEDLEPPDVADVLAVRTALASLPPRQRAALVLSIYDGMSTDEVAAVLRITPGSVRSLTHAGRTRLRDLLAFRELHANDRSMPKGTASMEAFR